MVVSCIAEHEAEIALTVERRKIASWPDHYGAYTRAMEESGRMGQALEAEARLGAVEAELSRIHARVLGLQTHQEAAAAENRGQRAHQDRQARDEEQAHRQSADAIRIRQQTAAREAQAQEERGAALDRQQADWRNRDLLAKALLLGREPELRERLGELGQRREALLGEQERIALRYERLLTDLDGRHIRAETLAGEARTALFHGFEFRFKALDTEADRDRGALRDTHAGARAAIDARLQEAIERKGAASQLARTPQPDPDQVAVRDAKQAAVVDLRAALEDRLRLLRGQSEELESRRETRLLQQNPGEDTLLWFLRTRRPDWVFDIAKVVREDLLVRTDLDPEPIDTLQALYGVGLDLTQVEAHLAADEAGLRREIAELLGPAGRARGPTRPGRAGPGRMRSRAPAGGRTPGTGPRRAAAGRHPAGVGAGRTPVGATPGRPGPQGGGGAGAGAAQGGRTGGDRPSDRPARTR